MDKIKDLFQLKLRFKITLVVLATSLLTVFGAYAVSRHFIENFYIRNAMNNLVKTYESCNEFFTSEDNLTQLRNGNVRSLYGYISNPSSCTIFIMDQVYDKIYSTITPNDKVEGELKRLTTINDFGLDKYKEKHYSIDTGVAKNSIFDDSGNFYSLYGILDNDLIIVLRMPVEQLTRSINFAVSFFAFVSFAFILIEIAAVIIISNTFTSPII